MPELPEVETVKRGLEVLLDGKENKITHIKMGSKKLRSFPTLEKLLEVKNQRIVSIKRRAKYLLFELDQHYLLSHLGMTGSWRIEKEQEKHDHIQIFLSDGQTLTYRDPRRFGMFDVIRKKDFKKDQRFSHLGPDPVLDSSFTADYLYQKSRQRQVPIKIFIMNQETVVGVGNIYASEALYLAGIHPLTPAKSLSKKDYQKLVRAIKDVLLEAIACGGTTISDFKQAGGSSGYFQNFLLAYGRDKESCHFCGGMISSQVIGGRNSYWCPRCQKKKS